MAVLKGTVVEKSEVYMARSGSRRWPTFTLKVRQQRGIVVTVYARPDLHDAADESDIVEISGKWTKGRAFSVGAKDSIVCRGNDKEHVKQVREIVIPDDSFKQGIDLEYVARPRMRHGTLAFNSKVGDSWISIPVAVAQKDIELDGGKWPNNGFGTLVGLVTMQGVNITVHKVVGWKPDTEIFADSIPLNEVYFGHKYIQFNLGGCGFHIHESKLPFPSLITINQIRESLDGDLVLMIDGYKVRTGHWNSATKSVHSEWVMSNTGDVTVRVSDEVLEKFQAVQHDYEQQLKWNEGVEMIKKLIAEEDHSLDDIVSAVKKIVPNVTDEEVMDIIKEQWVPEYDQAYFNGLAKMAKEIYPYADGFVCIIRDAAIIERTEAGAASYIFDVPDFDGGVKELITIFNGFNLLELRKERVAQKVGLKGVAIHTDLGSWSMKVAETIVDCEARQEPLMDGNMAILAVILGIKLKHSELVDED
jgi:hypothetical protein